MHDLQNTNPETSKHIG